MTLSHVLVRTLKRQLTAVALCSFSMLAVQAETIEQSQVAGDVTLSGGTEYVVTSTAPFAASGVVNIVDTDNSVLILTRVIPSQALTMLSHVKINGAPAVNGTNCQVKIYANGSIIMPYGSDLKPLTVYTDLDQKGESEQFAVGRRVSLQGREVNNRIRSFVLKRGYMATFMTKADGKGYSRVFIADKADLTVNLPAILDRSISALRVMQWNDVSKKGLAGGDATLNTVVNTTWRYGWDAGNNPHSDREYVTQRHHESGTKNGKYEGAWPSVEDCSNNGTSPHILGQNEPDNTGDPREVVTKVEDLLRIWPELMATGKRLGSPAMSSNLNMLYQFLDSIDARGWRCDFVAVHSYWYSDWGSWQWNFNNIHNRTGRPLWITEMNYGANWTGWPGADRSGSDANLAIEKQHMAPIIDGLESTDYVERYGFYNWVEDCRSLYLNGKLTPIGQYYADMQSKLAFNRRNEYVPRLPKSKGAPADLSVRFDARKGVATLSWYEPTGEYNQSMTVERQRAGMAWESVSEVTLQEDGASYLFDDTTVQTGDIYRIHVVYADGKDYYSSTVKAVPERLDAGDAVQVDGTTKYLGGNLLVNGSFDLGTEGWTNGQGSTLSRPQFDVFPVGGADGGSYLQAFGNGAADDVASVRQHVALRPNTLYYCSASARFSGMPFIYLSLSTDGKTEDKLVFSVPSSTTWVRAASTFNTESYTGGIFSFRRLQAKAQIDQISLAPLFDTREEALADGLAAERLRVAAIVKANSVLPALNTALQTQADGATTATLAQLTEAADATLRAVRLKASADSALLWTDTAIAEQLGDKAVLTEARKQLVAATTAAAYLEAVARLKALVVEATVSLPTDKVLNGSFANATSSDWTVKAGTYTQGRQTTATVAGKPCWQAEWTGMTAADGSGKTMAIEQKINGFERGLYVLECKATTQHGCLTDQHAFMITKTDTVTSPVLTADYLDLPTVSDEAKWQTLTTAPVYLTEEDTVTIGFMGSKQGAADNVWREYDNTSSTGDLREGSWAATDFVLRRLPVYHTTVDASGWTTICLPYAAKPTSGVTFYHIAGMDAEKSRLYIEPIDETAAGVPCIVYSDHPQVVVVESGEAVTRPSTGDNNLRGLFLTSAVAPRNSLVLSQGSWVVQESSNRAERAALGDYEGYLTKLSGITVLGSWNGQSLPLTTTTGISRVGSDKAADAAVYYSVDGRRISAPHDKGVYIRVQGGKATKVSR